jgi:integrase/recombinase XerC
MKKKKKSGRSERLPKHVRRHGSGFRVVITIAGKRKRSPTYSTVEECEDWIDEIQNAPDLAIVSLTLDEGLQLVLNHVRATDGREDTISYYASHFTALCRGLGGKERPLVEITSDDVRGYIAARLAEGVKATTITKKELGLLRRMMRLARDAGCPVLDAFDGIVMPKARTVRFDYLTQQQVAEVVAKMRSYKRGHARFWADVVELLFATGLRRAELVRMRVKDIDLERGRIFIAGKARDRHQTFGRSLEPALRRLIAAAKPDGRIVADRDIVNYQFRRWRIKLGLREFSPHVMRHSYGTAMAERVSQWQLMGLMDHADLKQTARYYHARGDDVRDALDGLRLDLQATPPTEPDVPPALG